LGVRGTDFLVDQAHENSSALTLTVFSGRVVVNSPKAQVDVPAGNTLRVAAAQRVPEFINPATGQRVTPPQGIVLPPSDTQGERRPRPAAPRRMPQESTPPGFSGPPPAPQPNNGNPAQAPRLAMAAAQEQGNGTSDLKPASNPVNLLSKSTPSRGTSSPSWLARHKVGDDSYESQSTGQASRFY
jgi:hypothetical protein